MLWQVTTEFDENWATGRVLGWENVNQENGHVPAQHTAIDLDYYSTVEELMEVGPERLKEVKN
jgi:splicing factor 3A subunit 3